MRTQIKYNDPETNTGYRFAFVSQKLQDTKVIAEGEQFIDATLPNGSAVVIATKQIIDMQQVD